MRRVLLLAALLLAAGLYASAAQAQTATLSGTAVVEGSHVKLLSDFSDDPANTANNFGVVTFAGTGVTTFASLTNLAAVFNVTDDACLGGSPRFQLGFAGTTSNIFVYLGAHNATTGQFDCAPNTWISSGNLIGTADLRYDLTQFGGPFYGTHAQALALVGGLTVATIQFVVDGGWAFADKEQTVLLRTAAINAHTFRFGTAARTDSPAQICRALRAAVGETAFVNTWGTNANKRNAHGKCVSHHAKLQQQATVAAQNACKDLRGQERRQCVATSSAARFEARRAAFAAAIAACRTELAANRAQFLQQYGKGAKQNVKAAFAACVRSKR